MHRIGAEVFFTDANWQFIEWKSVDATARKQRHQCAMRESHPATGR